MTARVSNPGRGGNRLAGRAARLLAWAWLAGSGAALAEPFEVESGPFADRAAAEAVAAEVGPDLGAPVTVARRYLRGEGWRFVVRAGAFDDGETARAALARLDAPGRPARLIDLDGRRVVAVGSGEAAAPAPMAPSGAVEAAGEALPAASAVLRAAVRAHGGRGGGLDVLARAGSVRFAFERRVPLPQGTLVVRHELRRAGDRWRLDVDVVEGQGVDSTTIVDGDGRAWVVVDGAATERDRARTREILDAFAPEQLLGLPLRLPGDVGRSPTWDGLRTEALDGNLVVLGREGEDAGTGLQAAAFDRESGTLARVRWRTEDGDLEYDYGDYRTVARGLVVPFAIDIRRAGTVIESVRVEALRLDESFDPGTFTVPPEAEAPESGGEAGS